MFEWHFTIRGAEGTEFEGGIYHGRILLPPEYPFKPPHIIFLTPSGRFETNTKVCLSFSAFHPELWQPAWGIRLILEALISFLPTPADGAIGALDWTKEERQRLAKLSQSFSCPQCGKCQDLLPQLKNNNSGDENNNNNSDGKRSSNKSRFAKEIEELQRLQRLAEKKVKPDDAVAPTASAPASAPTEQEDEQQQPLTAENEEGAKARTHEPVTVQNTTTTTTPTTTNNLAERLQDDSSTKAASNDDSETVTDSSTQAQATPPTTTTTTTATANNNHVVVEENPIPALEPPLADHSWIFDPILNIMIIVLAAICYLLLQKYQDLMGELIELRRLSDMGKQ